MAIYITYPLNIRGLSVHFNTKSSRWRFVRIDRARWLRQPTTAFEGELMSKVWLITGSSRGLGHALAEAALARGDSLVATARNPAQLIDLAERYGDRVRTVALDVTDEAAAERAVRVAIDNFGRLDVLVNNAGYGNVNAIEDTSVAEFREQIETNLFGTIIMTKAAIPWMREQRSGHIIQFSSVGGRVGALGRAPYSAAKWGVEGFSESLAKEVGPLGIKVTVVEPGGFRTDFAGTSSTIRQGRPEYDATVGATARFQHDYNGKQPGDPAKAAAAVCHIAGLDEPPLRLLLGSDAVRLVEQTVRTRMEADRKWRDLSVSTDFDA
jgi:NAD(P)-dependent dehydrogenase (short-subunit alcohol dehydrogenase family)